MFFSVRTGEGQEEGESITLECAVRSWGVIALSPHPLQQAVELLEVDTVNLHCMEMYVQRCDHEYWYLLPTNLEELSSIMYRWLSRGQGWICKASWERWSVSSREANWNCSLCS